MNDPLIEEEISGATCLFDTESYAKFKNDFWRIDLPLTECPKCKENREINSSPDRYGGYHNYADYFVCFTCKYRLPLVDCSKKYFLDISSEGYLSRVSKDTSKEEFFHRWLMAEKIKECSVQRGIKHEMIVVHHFDADTLNNSFNNLKLMTESDHHKHHATKLAFETWSEKTGSRSYGDFIEWLDKKEEESYG